LISNPAVTFVFTARCVPRAVGGALLGGPARQGHLRRPVLTGHVRACERGQDLPGTYPISTPGGTPEVAGDGDRADRDPGQYDPQHRDRRRSIGHNAAIAVGATVALLGLFANPISGASMIPARSLGPDIAGNDYTGWWVYVVGPVIGSQAGPVDDS
jgi:hypothetical protein